MFLKGSKPIITAISLLCGVLAFGQSEIAETPPMGWNSYDCFSYAVNETEVQSNADFMVKNLKKLGWEYVVIDYVWSCPRLAPDFALNQDKDLKPRLNMDENGRLLPDLARFPSSSGGKGFGPLAESLHKKGLKFGIHLMRGIPRQAVVEKSPILGSSFTAADAYTNQQPCGWLNHMWGLDMSKPASQAYLDSIFKLYAQWGVDFVKVDDLSNPYSSAEVEGYRLAIQHCGRPIVLSLSPGPTPLGQGNHVTQYANMWRLLGDLWDTWDQLDGAFRPIAEWTPYRGAGHWPDPDMLPLGRLRKYGPSTGPANTDSRLTKEEARTMMTLWAVSKSPLMFGGNLPDTDPYTLSLITNPEVLNVNQHSSGNHPLSNGLRPMWAADTKDPRLKILAVFNRSDKPATIAVRLSDLGVRACNVRDIWQRKDLGPANEILTAKVAAHGAMMYQLFVTAEAETTEAVLPTTNLQGDSYEAESSVNTLSGATRVVDDVAGGKCSGGKLVRFIGSKPENTLRFNKISADHEGDYIVSIVYMTGSRRDMYIAVNGGPPQKNSFPATGGWDGNYLDSTEIKVHLKAGMNTLEFGNPTDWGVDVDRIVVRPAGSISFLPYLQRLQ